MCNENNTKGLIFSEGDVERAKDALTKLMYIMESHDLTDAEADYIQFIIEKVEVLTEVEKRFTTPLIGMESDVIDLTLD